MRYTLFQVVFMYRAVHQIVKKKTDRTIKLQTVIYNTMYDIYIYTQLSHDTIESSVTHTLSSRTAVFKINNTNHHHHHLSNITTCHIIYFY